MQFTKESLSVMISFTLKPALLTLPIIISPSAPPEVPSQVLFLCGGYTMQCHQWHSGWSSSPGSWVRYNPSNEATHFVLSFLSAVFCYWYYLTTRRSLCQLGGMCLQLLNDGVPLSVGARLVSMQMTGDRIG